MAEIVISVPQTKSKSFFSSVSDEIVALVENGSPQDLKQAAGILHKNGNQKYSDAEKTLLIVASGIMKILWPSETITWEMPKNDLSNVYAGAIDSALRGIYDLSTGNSDFLSTVLPALALETSSSPLELKEISRGALEKSVALKNDSVLVNYLLGELSMMEGEYEKALVYYSKCARGNSGSREIIYGLGKANAAAGEYEEALECGESLLDRFPQDLEILQLCAESSVAMGNLEKAEGYVIRVLLIEPENTDYVLLRAKILMQKEDYIRASSLLDVCAKTSPNSREYLILRAKLQRDWNKNSMAATETASKAMALYPDYMDVLILAAEISSSTGNNVNGMTSLEIAQRILSEDSENTAAIKVCISELSKLKEWGQAYDLSQKLVSERRPSISEICTHIDLCIVLNKRDEAFKYASDLYSSNSNDDSARQAYVKGLIAAGNRREASAVINQFFGGSSQKMKSFLYYEKSRLSNDEEEVLADLRSSLTANPRNRDSLYRLYEIYYSKKDWRRAQYYLKQVVSLDPSNSDILKKNSELDRLISK